MNLVKKELKDSFKSVLIWVSTISLLIIMIVTLHPVAIEKMDMMGDMLDKFPKEMLRALNIDITTTFKNILSYFFYESQFILVAGCIFAGILGAGIIAKEENEKTIQFLYSKPMSRSDILLGKISVVLIYLALFNILLFGVTAIAMDIISDQSIDYLLLSNIFVGQLIIQITFAFLGIVIATLLKKPKVASSIIGGIIITTFILGIISKIADKVAKLSYISPISYLSNDKFMDVGHLEIKYFIILTIIIVTSGVVAMIKYKKKDFNI